MKDTKAERFIEARVLVPRELCDAVCNFIVDNIASGLVLEEEEGSPNTGIMFYLPEHAGKAYHSALESYLKDVLPNGVPDIRERLIENAAWEEQYKASIQPLHIAGDIVIRPPWDSPVEGTRYDIVIEPKMAFGTGSHETTRSCLTVIRKRFQKGMRLLDLGTGSGILSILADKMGASYVKAIDYDSIAVQNCAENVEINSVRCTHEILLGSIDKCEGDEAYDFVCANIIKSTILPFLPRLVTLTKVGGFLVLSGLLDQDESEISGSLRELGQTDFEILYDNEWITYTVKRK